MAAVNLTKQQFEELLAQGKSVLVDYWAPWCGYCRRIAPAYEKIAGQYGDPIIAKVNINDEPLLAHQENIEVIPTLVLYKNGQAVDSIVAPQSKATIEAFIERAM